MPGHIAHRASVSPMNASSAALKAKESLTGPGSDPLTSPEYVRELKLWIRATCPHRKLDDKTLRVAARRLTVAARPQSREETRRVMSDAVHYLRAHAAAGRKPKSALTHSSFEAYVKEAKRSGSRVARRVAGSRVKRALARYLNEPDPIELVLTRAATVKRSDEERLDRFSHTGIPDHLWQPVYALVRGAILARNAKGIAKRDYLCALRCYMLWRLRENLSVAPEDLFNVTDLRRFEFRRSTVFDPHGVGTYRSKLRLLARVVAPAVVFPPNEPLPLTGHRPETYILIRVEDALTLARSQPNETIGRSLLAFIHVAAGSPLLKTALPTLRGTDIARHDDGTVMIRHGDLNIPVHRDHATELLAVANRAGGKYVLMPHLMDRKSVVKEMHDQVVGVLRDTPGHHRVTFSGLRRHYTARALHESGVIALIVARGSATLEIDRALVRHVIGELSPAQYLAQHGAWLGAA